MNLPEKTDYINFHDHGTIYSEGVFAVDNIMAHEGRTPTGEKKGISYSVGAHPWFLDTDRFERQLLRVKDLAAGDNIAAIGETGFDKLKGPSPDLQKRAFKRHYELAEELSKPLIIHCVRAWPEIIDARKKFKPTTPWIIHGFKGKRELAQQLTDKGFFLSAWVEWAIRPVSADTLKNMPIEKLFLETDGFDIGIEPVYQVVAGYLDISIEQLKRQMYNNYMEVLNLK